MTIMKLIEMGNIPNITRLQFANLESKVEWERKIINGSNVYTQLEYLTVAHDIRRAMIDHFATPYNIDERAKLYASMGLMIVPIREYGLGGSFHVEASPSNGNIAYRAVVAKRLQDIEEFIYHDSMDDHVKIGEMLGYPTSSGEFFADVWSKGYVDPIWQKAENTGSNMMKNKVDFKDLNGDVEKRLIRIRESDDYWMLNSAFRYIGIKLTSHIPRSFDDKESLEVAKKYYQLAKDLGLKGLDDVVDILKLPYEWDCLKGIAEINTPVFKLVVGSVPCFPNHVVQQESSFYPRSAPMGIKFPWNLKTKVGGC